MGLSYFLNFSYAERSLSQITGNTVCCEADVLFAEHKGKEQCFFQGSNSAEKKERKVRGNYQDKKVTILVRYMPSDG